MSEAQNSRPDKESVSLMGEYLKRIGLALWQWSFVLLSGMAATFEAGMAIGADQMWKSGGEYAGAGLMIEVVAMATLLTTAVLAVSVARNSS